MVRGNARGHESVKLSLFGNPPPKGPQCKGVGVVAAAGLLLGLYKRGSAAPNALNGD